MRPRSCLKNKIDVSSSAATASDETFVYIESHSQLENLRYDDLPPDCVAVERIKCSKFLKAEGHRRNERKDIERRRERERGEKEREKQSILLFFVLPFSFSLRKQEEWIVRKRNRAKNFLRHIKKKHKNCFFFSINDLF